jgi:hypothetical protein
MAGGPVQPKAPKRSGKSMFRRMGSSSSSAMSQGEKNASARATKANAGPSRATVAARNAVASARATDSYDAFKEMMGISYTPVGAARINPNQFKKGATDAVAFQLNGSLNSLTRQANKQREDFAYQDTNLRNNQAQAGSDLEYILRALNDKMTGIQGSTNNTLNAGRQATDANFAQLQQAMAAKNSQVDAEVAAETQRMGLSNNQKVDAEISRNADQDFLEGLAANNRSSAAALLQQQQGNYNQQAGQMQAAEQASFANKQADVKQTYGKALSELARSNMQALADIGSKKQDIEAQRNYLIQQRIDSMASAAQEAAEKRAQQNFANQMAVNNFNMGVSKQNYDQEYDRATLAISRQRLSLDAQKAKSAAGGSAKPVKGVSGVATLFGELNMDPRVEQTVMSGINAFARGDYRGAVKDTKANKAEVRDAIRENIQKTSGLKGDDLTTTVQLLNEALDVYWDGI